MHDGGDRRGRGDIDFTNPPLGPGTSRRFFLVATLLPFCLCVTSELVVPESPISPVATEVRRRASRVITAAHRLNSLRPLR
jgi:hypothetical protein